MNAPIQNREFNPDGQLGKVVPLFVAAHLRTQDAYMSTPVELWNNVIAQEQLGYDARKYEIRSTTMLDQKYGSSVLSLLHSQTGEAEIIADDDSDFTKWATTVVESGLDSGNIRIEEETVYVCQDCHATLALAHGPKPRNCACCYGSGGINELNTVAMTATITPEALVSTAHATKQSIQLDLSGRKFIINKRRVTGVGLEWAGFADDVLDPRIGVGLLGLYAAIRNNADAVDFVSSRSAISHNLPQFFAAIASQCDTLPALEMVGIAKAPANYLSMLVNNHTLSADQMVSGLKDRLAPQLLKMRKDMTPQCAEQLLFSRRFR
ncbi:MAG TPA: hypothetical protein VF575_00845 [Candidatus Saccharimonadales bacterium]|jgi:hypothetical protein